MDQNKNITASYLYGADGVVYRRKHNAVAHWHFDEENGTIAHDVDGANHGTLGGGRVNKTPTWSFGCGLLFDGVNDLVKVPDTDALNLVGDKITIAAWVQPHTAKVAPLVEKINKTHGYRISLIGTKLRFVLRRNGQGKTVTSTTTLPLHTWTHVAARYDGAQMRIFINGTIESANTPAPGALSATTAPLFIGSEHNHFHGYLDDISIYDRALSDSEITELVNDVDKWYQYHHINALGSNIVSTDDNQNVLVRYEYDVFGAIRSETGTSDNTRKFTGKEFDADSNLYYYAARYYDPYIGRFTQRDPVGQGVNWYAYTANNPLKYTDPTGMWLETFVDVVGLGLSIYDFVKNPSLGNAAWVALDAGAVLAPFVPGTKTGRIAFKWVTKSDPAIEFKNVKSFHAGNARRNLIKATKVSEKVQNAHEAHHIIPKSKRIQAELDRVGATINVHQPALLTWWKKETHSTNWKKYEDEWMDFFSQHTHLTNGDVLLQAQKMAESWKGHFYNEEYYIKGYELVPHSAGGNYDPYDQN